MIADSRLSRGREGVRWLAPDPAAPLAGIAPASLAATASVRQPQAAWQRYGAQFVPDFDIDGEPLHTARGRLLNRWVNVITTDATLDLERTLNADPIVPAKWEFVLRCFDDEDWSYLWVSAPSSAERDRATREILMALRGERVIDVGIEDSVSLDDKARLAAPLREIRSVRIVPDRSSQFRLRPGLQHDRKESIEPAESTILRRQHEAYSR